jgi:alpha-1,3-glucan synthase
MADLIGFDKYLNATTPFDPKEHQVVYKDPDQKYIDFRFGNTYNNTCDYPRFWNESGGRVLKGCTDADDFCNVFDQLDGCYDSEFDQVSGRAAVENT